MIEINVSDSQACEANDARNEALALCKQANEIKPSRASAKNQRWLAMQALALDPLCVDAFVILAKCSDDAEALEKQGLTVDKRTIALKEPLKELGAAKVAIKLHKEVSAEITVEVVAE